MKRTYFVCLFLYLTTTFLLSQSNSVPQIGPTPSVSPSSVSQPAQDKILDSYGKLPLAFEANHGQTDARVKFLSRTGAYTLFLTGDEAVLALNGNKLNGNKTNAKARISHTVHTLQSSPIATNDGVLRMKLRNANPVARVTGMEELTGTSNYFIGNNPAKWRTNIPTYAKVKYEGIYSGIDLVYYGNQRQLEYDFIVVPGADPRRIEFEIGGAKSVRRGAYGELVFKMSTGENEIRWHKPVVYQEKDGVRQQIAARYAITDTNRVRFELAKYDAGRPLYIDPLIYSTYLGGSSTDFGHGIVVDSNGNAYITGQTSSGDFPVTNPFQPTLGGGSYDAFVTKLNATGSALVYSTYLGGSGNDSGAGIAVDSGGNAYITGYTTSFDFPLMNPFQSMYEGGNADAFVTKLNATGSALVYSTYLGGAAADGNFGYGIAVDSSGQAYVTGETYSTDFPTKDPLQPANGGSMNIFVTVFNPSGSALIYSTYLGGIGAGGFAIAVDSARNAYVAGITGSGFPTVNALQPTYGGGGDDAIVAKINSAGSALIYATYLGGNGDDYATGIAADSAGNAYIIGRTTSTDFPTYNAVQPTYGGAADAFVTKINSAGSAFIYSSYLGGSSEEFGLSITADSSGNAYVTGATGSTNFPTVGALQKKKAHGFDVFISKLNASGSALVYSTYLGGSGDDYGAGIAVDSAGNNYITGSTSSTNFPTVMPLQAANAGGTDAFVTKLFIATPTATTLSSSPNPSAYGEAVSFAAMVTSALGPPPDGEIVNYTKDGTVLGIGKLTGGATNFTTSALKVGTNPIAAAYGGDSQFSGSASSAVNQVVHKATTTTVLASSENPSKVGQSVTFTATVSPEFSGVVAGTVTFYDGTTVLKNAAVKEGVAECETSKLTSGKHNIKATYNGDGYFTGSSGSLTQTVN